MDTFYSPDLSQGANELSPEEARHCTQVLRKKSGDSIELCDGLGLRAEARILEASKKKVYFEVKNQFQVENPLRPFHLFLSPPKSSNRLEWLIEKGTEIGLYSLNLLQTFHSERRSWRLDRLERLAVAAMKQSGRSHLPKLREAGKFSEALLSDVKGRKLIAHCDSDFDRNGPAERTGLPEILSVWDAEQEELSLFIGPEGDFSSQELEIAVNAGCQPVHLGEARLRTETAALAALCLVQLS
jgi:16S rRNA (uracil1498-N3)-methyltransferase